MNKKNLSISLSLFITAIFFTFCVYIGYVNNKFDYEYFRNRSIYDAKIMSDTVSGESSKLKEIKNIKEVGEVAVENNSAKLSQNVLVVNYIDQGFNKMLEDSILKEGSFAAKDNEITIPKSLAKKENLKIGDKIKVEFGNRYNENMKIFYASTVIPKDAKTNSFVRFHNFRKAYNNKDNLEKNLASALNKDKVELEFSEIMKDYYNVDGSLLQQNRQIIVDSLLIFATILIFIFFVKNIFTVWGLRKIREISMYKSIGSTDYQIYKLLLKDGLKISLLPIVMGHVFGYGGINLLYLGLQRIVEEEEKYKYIEFSPRLSLVVLLICFFIIFIAIFSPAKKIAKINIIDGIKGNFSDKNIKLKKNKNIWKELKINNLKTISSQRYISAIGMIIVSIFLIVFSMAKYNRVKNTYTYNTNINILIHSNEAEVPNVLKDIMKTTENHRAFLSTEKYISLSKEQNYSDEFRSFKLDEKMRKYYDNGEDFYLDGIITALDDETFEKIGGKKGEALLLNKVQVNPNAPIDGSETTKYFENMDILNYSITEEKNYNYSIKVDKLIDSTKDFRQRRLPFYVYLYVDFDTYFKLLDDWNKYYLKNNNDLRRNTYELSMQVDENKLDDIKNEVKEKLDSSIAYNETYNLTTSKDVEASRMKDVKTFGLMIISIAGIIFILNITNGYSSINLSLMARKKEIGSLMSCGIDGEELIYKYTRDFILEEIKSLAIVLIVSFAALFVIAKISPYFLAFGILIYGINILIYKLSLKNILKIDPIDLIRGFD
ncbi:MAG: FtsX-like permease family protein [Peptoniphilus harei]|uniref:ABC transporter permease n=1 Tax=Peptoniphilus harei TaxID=54005 RepID=UPI002900FE37|nr:FtsX-like permease family protein [Peptoniphilus harei]MDU3087528.1 FtsX-like permease family protein [Peptoniphilus harei]